MCTVYYVLPSNSLKENAPLQFLFKGSIDDEEEDDFFPSMTSFLLISIISLSYKVINMDWIAILNSCCGFFFTSVTKWFFGCIYPKKEYLVLQVNSTAIFLIGGQQNGT